MGKSLFTIIFLIIALLVIGKIQSFVKNNQPITVPEEPVYMEFPADSIENETLLNLTSTTTIEQATTSQIEAI